jgi:hypothetical protein
VPAVKVTTMDEVERQRTSSEKLITLKQAGEALGLPHFKLQRAARDGIIPTYRIYNSRRLVRLSEVIAVIERSRSGGA